MQPLSLRTSKSSLLQIPVAVSSEESDELLRYLWSIRIVVRCGKRLVVNSPTWRTSTKTGAAAHYVVRFHDGASSRAGLLLR